MEALLYECMTWEPRRDHYRLLRRTHHGLLLRVIGYRREHGTYRQLSYAHALKKNWVQKRGGYHPTTATSVRGRHSQTTRRAPPEAADGQKTSQRGRSRLGTPRAELAGLSQGRLSSVRSHGRLCGGEPVNIRRESYGPLQRRWTMGRRGTRGSCRERKKS